MKKPTALFEQFKAHHSHGRSIVQHTGLVGAFAFPLFYLLRFAKTEPPFDDMWLRIIATLMCLALATRGYWPTLLRPYYHAFSYVTMLYCLPFFAIFTSLMNGGGVVAVANTMMSVFFLIFLTDWRNCSVMMFVAAAMSTFFYVAVTPNPSVPMDYVARFPTLLLVLIGGSVFKLSEKRAESERVQRIYSALAGSIAHEMRNPLGQVKHSLQSLRQMLPAFEQRKGISASQSEALHEQLNQGELAVKRGLLIISMTLDELTSKPLDASAFSYISAADVTRKALREYCFEHPSDRERVDIHVEQDFSFRGDETAYMYVIFNLLKNAVYYFSTHPLSRVTITITNRQVSVLDTGPGMSDASLSQLFEPFSSVGKAGGTGLGLAYCQRTMVAFGGSISCRSEMGLQTEFILSFAKLDLTNVQMHREAVIASARIAFEGKRLMVVDDDATLRLTTRHKLQPLGILIDEAANGERALELMSRNHYDLIVLDLNMPVMSGFELAESIRVGRSPGHRDVCIVGYSSDPENLVGRRVQECGMDGFINKPCAQVPFIVALQNFLAQAGGRYAQRQLAGRTVLVADDSAVNRTVVIAYLQQAGAHVLEAANGQEVLDKVEQFSGLNAIVMDIHMPGINGIEAARAINEAARTGRPVPIIGLTAHASELVLHEARSAGMQEILIKPVDASVLLRTLGRICSPAPTSLALLVASPEPKARLSEGADDLLNLQRLEAFEELGALDELLADYLPDLRKLIDQLHQSVEQQDQARTVQVLHTLLGMTAEAGAQKLHQAIRSVYVPIVEEDRWPAGQEWLAQVRHLGALSEQALERYSARARTVPSV